MDILGVGRGIDIIMLTKIPSVLFNFLSLCLLLLFLSLEMLRGLIWPLKFSAVF